MSRIAISPLVTQTRVIHANIACMPQAEVCHISRIYLVFLALMIRFCTT